MGWFAVKVMNEPMLDDDLLMWGESAEEVKERFESCLQRICEVEKSREGEEHKLSIILDGKEIYEVVEAAKVRKGVNIVIQRLTINNVDMSVTRYGDSLEILVDDEPVSHIKIIPPDQSDEDE